MYKILQYINEPLNVTGSLIDDFKLILNREGKRDVHFDYEDYTIRIKSVDNNKFKSIMKIYNKRYDKHYFVEPYKEHYSEDIMLSVLNLQFDWLLDLAFHQHIKLRIDPLTYCQELNFEYGENSWHSMEFNGWYLNCRVNVDGEFCAYRDGGVFLEKEELLQIKDYVMRQSLERCALYEGIINKVGHELAPGVFLSNVEVEQRISDIHSVLYNKYEFYYNNMYFSLRDERSTSTYPKYMYAGIFEMDLDSYMEIFNSLNEGRVPAFFENAVVARDNSYNSIQIYYNAAGKGCFYLNGKIGYWESIAYTTIRFGRTKVEIDAFEPRVSNIVFGDATLEEVELMASLFLGNPEEEVERWLEKYGR